MVERDFRETNVEGVIRTWSRATGRRWGGGTAARGWVGGNEARDGAGRQLGLCGHLGGPAGTWGALLEGQRSPEPSPGLSRCLLSERTNKWMSWLLTQPAGQTLAVQHAEPLSLLGAAASEGALNTLHVSDFPSPTSLDKSAHPSPGAPMLSGISQEAKLRAWGQMPSHQLVPLGLLFPGQGCSASLEETELLKARPGPLNP